jgi:hypothetical protein
MLLKITPLGKPSAISTFSRARARVALTNDPMLKVPGKVAGEMVIGTNAIG